jgi:predicted nucleic acid-binding protein
MSLPRRYWDANCFLGWFLAEPDKVEACKPVVEAAEAGEIQIVTSAMTLTEVIKLKGHPSLPAAQEETIRLFFENPFLIIVNVDRLVGEYARQLIWQHSVLKPKDSIHIATAALSKIPTLDTFDGDMISLDGLIGNPAVRIGHPHMVRQQEMFGAATTTDVDENDDDVDLDDDSP